MTYAFAPAKKMLFWGFIVYTMCTLGMLFISRSTLLEVADGNIFRKLNLVGLLRVSVNIILVAFALGTCFLLYFFLRKTFDKGLGLFITDEGVKVDLSTAFSVGQIEWDNIADVKLVKKFGLHLLIIQIADPYAIISRQSQIKQFLMKVLLAKTGASVLISQFRLI